MGVQGRLNPALSHPHQAFLKKTKSSALVVIKKNKKKITAFERMNLTAEENEHGGNGHDHGGQQ